MGDFVFAAGLVVGSLIGWFLHAALVWLGVFGRMQREMNELEAEIKRDSDALKARIACHTDEVHAHGCRRTDGKI